MTSPARTTTLAGCRQCAGSPALVLDTISGSRLDNDRIAADRARQLGHGAHTHADLNTDMHVVRPLGEPT
ncbi:hypothetical protein ABT390_33915 [Streptomyces aurantiacus]|uniref:Uncharacterized protein n=1 Tax=Streptomyces aurantiacus JA 4570 TaxID=1286094 RepID=S4A7W9_9ACTN|nr:hypothetical protein [Streptomyces aurantiacus]EPH46885.1 hypothetical protein STRAU_0051 [Streptomyces aurantiacus JA 4570]